MSSATRLAIRVLAVAVLASACQPSTTGNTTTSEATVEAEEGLHSEILRVVEQWQADTGARGVLLAVEVSGDLISVGVGQANTDAGTESVQVDDRFDVFSITKTFIAAEVMLLEDQGILNLDDPIDSHVTELAGKLDASIRDLLSHRTGMADHRDSSEFWAAFFADLDREWTWDETVEYVLSQPLGRDGYSYSDTNYVILGHLIEVVTGQPLNEVLESNLFEPLGLDNTVMLNGTTPGVTYAYGELDCDGLDAFALDGRTITMIESSYCDDGQVSLNELPRTAIETFDSGASGVISSLGDLVRWARFLFSGQVVEDINEALPDSTGDYGLGIGSRETPLGPAFGHIGGGAFGSARLWYLPDAGITVAAWAGQTTNPDLDALIDRILESIGNAGGVGISDNDDVLAGLADPDPSVRSATAESLVGGEPQGAGVEQALIDLVTTDRNASVRESAILGLGAIARDSNSAEAIAALQAALLTDDTEQVRRNAALALAFVGSDSIPILEEARDSQSVPVQEAIDMALDLLRGDV